MLRGKPAVTRATFDKLLPELRNRAFTITGIEEFDTLAKVRESIASIAVGGDSGMTWDQAKAEITSHLDSLDAGAERRAELLLRTHGFQAFQAANWDAAQADEDTTHLQYLATEDAKVRDSHLALNGLILPKNDPFWDTHLPPWEWGCRCRIRPVNPDLLEEARQRDETVAPDNRYVMEGPALDQLRHGTLMRDGRRYDVRAPVDKASNDSQNVWQWHPDNLRLPLQDILDRYDPETRVQFERWAKGTKIGNDGPTVWEWADSNPVRKPSPTLPPTESAPQPPPQAQDTGGPAGTPVSEALTLGKFSKKNAAAIRHALAAIDSIHGDGALPKLAIRPKVINAYGQFVYRQSGPVVINIHQKGPWPGTTTIHEVGHFLDRMVIGKPNAYASEDSSSRMAKVIEVIRKTDAWKAIQEIPSSVDRAYYSYPRECWARAYAQFIAEASGSEQMRKEIELSRLAQPYRQWSDSDFAPVRVAIREMLQELGWIK